MAQDRGADATEQGVRWFDELEENFAIFVRGFDDGIAGDRWLRWRRRRSK